MSPPSYSNVLEMIGNTPLMAVRRLDTGPCELFLKLENQNPGGSIKDRIGLYLIEAAERAGRLKPGGTLIEATAGNTGLGLALVAAQKGYRLLLVDSRQDEPGEDLPPAGDGRRGGDDPLGRQQGPSGVLPRRRRASGARDARLLLRQPVRQSRQCRRRTRRPPRPRSGSRWGTSWTRWCAASAPAARSPDCRISSRAPPRTCEMVLADPVGSVLASYVRTGKLPREDDAAGWSRASAGIPCRRSRTSRASRSAYSIPDAEAFRTCRELLAQGRHHRRHLHRHAARGGAALLPRAAPTASASSASCATAATSTSPRSTTTTGCSIRDSSSASATATCAT